MAFDKNSLPSYVEQNASDLLLKTVMSPKSAKLFTLQTGVVGPTTLNLINTTPVLQDGSGCGFNASGDTVLSQRQLVPAILKVDMSWCDKTLLKTYAQHEVKIAAGTEKLPFEEKIVADVQAGIAEAIETMMYQGQSGQTDEFEGLISILDGVSGSTHNVSAASGTPAYTVIKNVYMATPAKVAAKSDFRILVSEALFRQFIQELVDANLYHYVASDAEGEYTLPGTKVKVVAVAGLDDTATYEYIIGARLSNLFYGVDQESDSEVFDIWYSKDNKETRLNVNFAGSVQVAYPNEIAVGKLTK